MTKSSGRISVVLFSFAVLVLASCTSQPESDRDQSKIVGAGSESSSHLPVSKPRASYAAAEDENTGQALSNVKESDVGSAAKISPLASMSERTSSSSPVPKISQLIGMNSMGLNDLLGKPLLVRREAEAEIWQYRNTNCVLHFFLYRDAINELPNRVVHVEANHTNRMITTRASVDLNSSNQINLKKLCFTRLFYQANALDNPN